MVNQDSKSGTMAIQNEAHGMIRPIKDNILQAHLSATVGNMKFHLDIHVSYAKITGVQGSTYPAI